jgi:hypothetical protein
VPWAEIRAREAYNCEDSGEDTIRKSSTIDRGVLDSNLKSQVSGIEERESLLKAWQ